MEHSDTCNSFESCDECYRTLYSFEATIARLEQEEEDRYIAQRLEEMERQAEEAIETKKERFKRMWGIHAYVAKVTDGERALRVHKRFKKWRVKRGSETPLRRAWTVIEKEPEAEPEENLDMLFEIDKENAQVSEGGSEEKHWGFI
jgi:predicted DsbA family dithiol-disulfide isomerase